MQALIVNGKSDATVQTVDRPVLGPGMILVKVHANALNPTDWKHLDLFGVKGSTLGSDFMGTVQEMAPDAEPLVKVGERVAGTVHGGYTVGEGAFAEYVATYPQAVTSVPDAMSDTDAAGLGVGGFTALMGLFQPKHLGLPLPDAQRLPPVDSSRKLLVWSGATSVGQFVTQAARAAGMYVIVAASEKNHEWMKTLGASDTYDYRDTETPAKIAEKHPDLAYAFDTFSEKGSTESCAKAMSKTKDGRVVTILPFDAESVAAVNPKVKPSFLLMYTVSGEETRIFGHVFDKAYCEEDRDFFGKLARGKQGLFHQLLQNGLVKPNRTSPQQGGREAIHRGLDLLRHNKVSGEKLVYAYSS